MTGFVWICQNVLEDAWRCLNLPGWLLFYISPVVTLHYTLEVMFWRNMRLFSWRDNIWFFQWQLEVFYLLFVLDQIFLQVRFEFAITFCPGSGDGHEFWYALLVFCFFLVKTCKDYWKIIENYCKIIEIQSFSSQLYEIIIDYLSKQCPGAILKVQSCKSYNNKYMITLSQITNTEFFAFIAVLVFKLFSRKVLFINRIDNRNCWKVGYFLRK